LPENTPLYEEMSVEGFLRYIAQVRGITTGNQKKK